MGELPFWFNKFTSIKKIKEITDGLDDANSEFIGSEKILKQSKAMRQIMNIIIQLANCKKLSQAEKQSFVDFTYELYKDIEISNKIYLMSAPSNQD
jgi:hypothetical protein